MTALTDRFARAVDYARIAHAGQVRKGTDIPYITHLLSVATLIIEHGGSEEQAIAGLLHDTLEDCGQGHEAIIRAQFGDNVARIVRACTDGTAEAKGGHITPEAKRTDWLKRKAAYLAHLVEADEDVLLVSGCDKLHNALTIVRDMETPAVGMKVFARFTGGVGGTLKYYESMVQLLNERGADIAAPLDAVVERMHALAGSNSRQPLPSTDCAAGDADGQVSHRFWFQHESGKRLYPYKSRDRRTGRIAFRVAPGAAGANKVQNQTQLDDVDEVYEHVFGKGWSVRLCSLDRSVEGLYNKDGHSIVCTSES